LESRTPMRTRAPYSDNDNNVCKPVCGMRGYTPPPITSGTHACIGHDSISCPTSLRDKTRQDKTKSGQSKAITSPSLPGGQMENIFYPLALAIREGSPTRPTPKPTQDQPTTPPLPIPSKWTENRVFPAASYGWLSLNLAEPGLPCGWSGR